MSFFNVPIEDTIVKCPRCVESSTVTLAEPIKQVRVQSHWDTLGRHHTHYLEPCVASFKCSRGHTFEIMESVKCWCGQGPMELADALFHVC